MRDHFLTISKTSEGIYKEKGSKFLSYAFPVITEQEAKGIIQQKKKEYHDARHVCFAYQIGVDNVVERANDDGEPSNSAGKPILNQIQSNQLTNVLVIVVRYFGGTLLGVSGLINAYKTSAADAISKCTILKVEIREKLQIDFDYPVTNEVMRIIDNHDIEVIRDEYAESCVLELGVKRLHMEEIINKFNVVKSLKIKELK